MIKHSSVFYYTLCNCVRGVDLRTLFFSLLPVFMFLFHFSERRGTNSPFPKWAWSVMIPAGVRQEQRDESSSSFLRKKQVGALCG